MGYILVDVSYKPENHMFSYKPEFHIFHMCSKYCWLNE